jgi:hypothetical protein
MMTKLQSLLILACCASLLGCGGGAGTQVTGDPSQLDRSLPPLDFTFTPPAETMAFKVVLSSEAEFRGTGIISSLNYVWTASDWQQEEGAWTADVTFSKIKAAMRRGSSIAMEPMDNFERLEGFSLRYRKDAEGFRPVNEPAKDRTFMALLGQLQLGLTTLDITAAPEPAYLGASWDEPIDKSRLDEQAAVITDSIIRVSYKANEDYRGRPCARLEYEGKIGLDGDIMGEDAGTRVKGSFEVKGKGLFDREHGFMIRDEGKIKQIMNTRELDGDGKVQGAERSLVQNIDLTVSFQLE